MDSSAPENHPIPNRHWCFTAWLVLATFLNLFMAICLHNFLGALNLIFIFGLYKWRRWGFLGFSVLATVFFVLNFSNGVGVLKSAVCLIGPAILLGVLNIGGDKKAWLYLK